MRRHFDPEPPALPDPVTFVKTATIVVDTSALLEPYRYSVGTRDTALEALEAVQDRLWMPYQVGVEFFRNHEKNRSALSQAYDQALAILEEARRDVREVFGTGKKFQESRGAVGKKVDGSLNRLKTTLGKLRDRDRAIIDEDDDPVVYRLTELYGDRLAPKPDPLTLRKRVEDFHQWRVPNQIPPGFRDIETKTHPTRAAGDYLIWAEVLEHAAQSECDVLLVTNDSKNDWWEQVPGGRPRPRRELVEEFAEQTGHAYQQLSLLEFIKTVKAAYGVTVEAGAVDEIAEIEEQDAQRRAVEFAEKSLADSESSRRAREPIRRVLEWEGGLPLSALAGYTSEQDRILKALDSVGGLSKVAGYTSELERIQKALDSVGGLSNHEPGGQARGTTLDDEGADDD
ncbi:PIN-like domain-containing protein [Promicromonospora soli]|uniref:PIN-like domain-containing protein n=1 Tax=Promicromonospora soli TaxID=2035533 RepID=UPI0016797CF9|nr:PIN-like domain-containing protein [Promicromonospora soli]